MSQFSFPINPALTAIAMAYRNPDQVLIADQVLPRIPVAQLFKYTKYDLAQGFTIPDTKVGPKSEPNKVDFGGTELQAQTADYGLDDLIAEAEIAAFNAMPKPATGMMGNGCHHNFSLWRDGVNVLAEDGRADMHLTDEGKHALGGVLMHAPGSMLVYGSTVNSYKRYWDQPWKTPGWTVISQMSPAADAASRA